MAHMGLEAVRLLVLDCDGVMTDGRVWLDIEGRESVAFHRSDGLGVQRLTAEGVHVVVVSGEAVPIVNARCTKLGIDCYTGVADKAELLHELECEDDIEYEQIAYIGNDLPDLECLTRVGFPYVPRDYEHSLYKALRLASVKFGTLSRRGGEGCVRELCEMIIEAKRAHD